MKNKTKNLYLIPLIVVPVFLFGVGCGAAYMHYRDDHTKKVSHTTVPPIPICNCPMIPAGGASGTQVRNTCLCAR